ncbi:sodium-dependent proline transporter-like isoform X3 [Aphis gossypii]|uniref:sodium-dependent proline transporter-like isoform X3 n=1 Tax=Aphis gossypii TaxID=80765 RepID=UPI00215959E4|nr:sodium-dependent proline transporter-like isoform X3 [Aphis gossypii]
MLIFDQILDTGLADRCSVVFHGNRRWSVFGQRSDGDWRHGAHRKSPIQSRCLYYMFWSLLRFDYLPWEQCSSMNDSLCITNDRYLEKCGHKSVGLDLQVPAENFYQYKIVEMDGGFLYGGVGKFNEPLLTCLAISWAINYLLLTASNKSMQYVKIFGSIAPFALLAFVSSAIMTDNDAWGGFNLLFDTSTIDFLDLQAFIFQSWRRAAEQVLYSLDVGTGHLIIYGANRSFHNNILGGVLLVTLLDTICAVTATIVVFGTANIVACKYHIQFSMVFKSGPGMFFVCISRVLADLPLPRLMSFISFFTLFVICILTQLSFLNPVIYLWNVYFPNHSHEQPHRRACILCGAMFILSLVTVTNGGEMIISILDDIGSAMGILMITTFEVILIFGIYGVSEFCVDLAFMSNKPPSILLKLLFIGGPVFTINIMLACSFSWISPSFQNVSYPLTMYIIAWIAAMLTLMIMMFTAIYTIVKFARKKNFFGSFEPTDRWVPDLNDLLINNELNSMQFEEEKMIYDDSNQLIFGIGKPKICTKIDKATQTNETNNQQLEHIGISNHLLQQFYLEILKTTNTPFEIERRHNETQVLAWNNTRCTEHLVEIGLMEKYTQTD